MDILLAGLKAVAEHTRLRLLTILIRNELTVSEITYILDQSQPRVSRHLKLMCDAGILDRVQEGAWVFYRVTDKQPGRELCNTLIELIPDDDSVVQRDLARLETIRTEHTQQAESYFYKNARQWDKLRSLYVSEKKVEQAMLSALADVEIKELLDLGTGTGRMLEVFGGVIEKGMGIDNNRDMLAIARAKLEENQLTHCQVRQGDIHNVSLPSGSIDVITVHHVLHFLNDPQIVISESSRLLKSGGFLLVVDFAPHDIELLREEHAHRRLGFSDQEITHWCENSGFTMMSIEHLQAASKTNARLTVTLWVAKKK